MGQLCVDDLSIYISRYTEPSLISPLDTLECPDHQSYSYVQDKALNP